jgi:hypothetical protein
MVTPETGSLLKREADIVAWRPLACSGSLPQHTGLPIIRTATGHRALILPVRKMDRQPIELGSDLELAAEPAVCSALARGAVKKGLFLGAHPREALYPIAIYVDMAGGPRGRLGALILRVSMVFSGAIGGIAATPAHSRPRRTARLPTEPADRRLLEPAQCYSAISFYQLFTSALRNAPA